MSFSVHIIDIPNITESILWQVTRNNKTGYVLVVYRSPSQFSDDFIHFLWGFNQVITDMRWSKAGFRLILGDFNCRPNSWWEDNISTKKGIDLESDSSAHGSHQLLPQSSSCTDLIFIDQWWSLLLACQLATSNNSLQVKLENGLLPSIRAPSLELQKTWGYFNLKSSRSCKLGFYFS